MKYLTVVLIFAKISFVYSQGSSSFNFIEKPFGKIQSFSEESWSADYELDDVVSKELIYKFNAKYDKFEVLRELQLNLAKGYDEKIVKCVFESNGNITEYYFEYVDDENIFRSLQTFNYNKMNYLLETRHFRIPYEQNEKAVFVKDSSIVIGKYIINGYIKCKINEQNIYEGVDIVGSFHRNLRPHSMHSMAFSDYYKSVKGLMESRDEYYDNNCNHREKISVTLGRVLNKEKIVEELELNEIRYEYKYDQLGNWIERILYHCERPIELVKRTLVYF